LDTGERLSAYLAGELDADERTAVEADLRRDPALRARLERLRRAERGLADLPAVDPPPGFSDRLRAAVAAELAAEDEVAPRRGSATARGGRPSRPWRTFGAAVAAAAGIVVLGAGAGVVLRGGSLGSPAAETAAGSRAQAEKTAAPEVTVAETDNDFDDLELQRLAVNVDTQFVLPPDLNARDAAPLAAELQDQLLGGEDRAASAGGSDGGGAEAAAQTADRGRQPAGEVREASPAGAPPAAVGRCLSAIVSEQTDPLIPVYVEVARYEAVPAVVYVFAAEEPGSGTYRRVEVWAAARSDCRVLSTARYDR
jgi:anti-sigma-K factor RskA